MGEVINDKIFILGWSNPLMTQSKHKKCASQKRNKSVLETWSLVILDYFKYITYTKHVAWESCSLIIYNIDCYIVYRRLLHSVN